MAVCSIPVIIQQMADELTNTKTSEHHKYNYLSSIMRVRDYCDSAIKQYERQVLTKNKG